MKILIVDDEPDTREVLETLLTAEGHAVRCAISAGDAFFRVGEFNPDLILLDIMLPGLDGLSAAAALRADERTGSIPVVHISARKDPEARSLSRRVGALYLEKPFSNDALLEAIREATSIPGARGSAG